MAEKVCRHSMQRCGKVTLELTQIRRLLLGLSLVIALLSGGAIYYVNSETAAIDARTVQVTAFTANQKDVAAMKKEFKDRGYEISTSSVKHTFQVPNGFHLVMDGMDNAMVKALGQALIQKNNIRSLGLEITNNGTALRIRKKFSNKAAAEKCAAKIKKEDSYNFKVIEATKDKTKMGFQCTIASIPAADSEDVMSYLERRKFSDVDSVYEEIAAPDAAGDEIEG